MGHMKHSSGWYGHNRPVWLYDLDLLEPATLWRRRELGEFHCLLQELRLDNGRFQRYFRLTVAQFEDLLARVGARISHLGASSQVVTWSRCQVWAELQSTTLDEKP